MDDLTEIFDSLVQQDAFLQWQKVGNRYLFATALGVDDLDEQDALHFASGALSAVQGVSEARSGARRDVDPPSEEVLNLADRVLDSLVEAEVVGHWFRDSEHVSHVHPARGASFDISGDEMLPWLGGFSFGQMSQAVVTRTELHSIRESLDALRAVNVLESWEIDVDEDSLTVWAADGESYWVPLSEGLSFLNSVQMGALYR